MKRLFFGNGLLMFLIITFAVSCGQSWAQDVDSDGDDDIVLRNTSTGAYRLYRAINGETVNSGSFALSNTSDQRVVAWLDIDADGDDDVLIRSTSGSWNFYTVQAGVANWSSSPGLYLNTDWVFQAVADLDNDGDDDIILRSTSTGSWRAFMVQSGGVTSDNGLSGLYTSNDYLFQGAADFDGDGDDDILLRSVTTGSWRLFTVEAGAVISNSNLALYFSNDYVFQAAEDFDKDGDADILLRKSTNGFWRHFEMAGGLPTANTYIAIGFSLDARFQVAADVDGDGDKDIITRQLSNGSWTRWEVEGDEIIKHGTINLPAVSDEVLPSSDIDSDSDGIPDKWEVAYGLDRFSDSAAGDADSDSINNLQEYQSGLNPASNDTDGDGFLDDVDATPLMMDADTDNMDDNWEVFFGLNTSIDDSGDDFDQDGLTNLEEFFLELDPANPADALEDLDGDGLSNVMEVALLATDPQVAELIGSGDAYVTNGSSPLYKMDLQTGLTTSIGATGIGGDAEGLAVDSSTTLYMVNEVTNNLYTLDTTTGVATLVGPTGISIGNGAELTFDNQNDLWMVIGSNFYHVSAVSGAATLIGAVGYNAQTLAYHNGQLYSQSGSNLIRINKSTGAGTLIGSLGISCSGESGMSTSGDRLWLLCESPGTLNTVDVVTGQATYVVSSGAWEGFAIDHRVSDQDQDGMHATFELFFGLDPNNPADAGLDPDQDGLTNLQEFQNNTNPNNADTDSDGITDGIEVAAGSNPLVASSTGADTDADGLSDIWEQYYFGDLSQSGSDDFDSDGASNTVEFAQISNPANSDSDGDGVLDGADLYPLDATESADIDADGVGDNADLCDATLTLNSDYDGDGCDDATQDSDDDNDGFVDSYELACGSNPLDENDVCFLPNSDVDGDGDDDVVLRSGAYYLHRIESGNVLPVSTFISDGTGSFAWFDMDGDGDKDVLRRATDGTWSVYSVQNGIATYASSPALYLNLDWVFQAAADVDNDGDDDIILRSISTGAWRVFMIESGAVISNNGLAGLYTSNDYLFQAAADFDADGDDDLLLRSVSTGSWRIFTVQSGAISFSSNLALYLSNDYVFEAAGDFDKDGDADILLRKSTNGFWRHFNIQAGAVVSDRYIAVGFSLDQSFQQIGDLDADGDKDVITRQISTGKWMSWTVENGEIIEHGVINGLPNAAGQILARSEIDSDSDGIPDKWEVAYGLDRFSDSAAADTDGDGINNLDEYRAGLNPGSNDTDGDGFLDNVDITPLMMDVDSDGMDDNWEVFFGLNTGLDDSGDDFDQDSLTNLDEFLLELNPADPADAIEDLDGDGLSNVMEVRLLATDASLADVGAGDDDSDGINNVYEKFFGLNSTDAADALADEDFDGLSNLQEFQNNTNPLLADTDGGGISDLIEISSGTHPLIATDDDGSDTDSDGLFDLWEQSYFGDLSQIGSGDYDGDGLSNLQELTLGANPLQPDTDGDGALDGSDNCLFVVNGDQLNTDGDAIGNACDNDDDNDGVVDALDNCPVNSNTNQYDADADGAGNACDATPYQLEGDLDANFVVGTGFNNTVWSAVAQSDGKIIVGGEFSTYNGIASSRIVRLNRDGSRDATFTTSITGAYINMVAVQPDGRILIVGNFTVVNGTARKNIARLNGDGSLDTTFNPGAGTGGAVFAVAIQADGKILIGGSFTSVDGVSRNKLARLNVDGSVDGSFNPDVAGSWVAIINLQADGKILAGGLFSTVGGDSSSGLVRLNTDGTRDTDFIVGSGVDENIIYYLTQQGDGKIYIGGEFSTYNGVSRNRIARLNQDGSLDESFDPGTGVVGQHVYTIVLSQNENKILISGGFSSYNGVSRNNVARLHSDGSLDYDFDSGTNGYVFAGMYQNGDIVIGGAFSAYNGVALNRIARFKGVDADNDGITDILDPDDDNDTILDDIDNCPLIVNPAQQNLDGDSWGDVCDDDVDGDGVLNVNDPFPLDGTEWADVDGDGTGDNADTDDDNDGIVDGSDNCPLIANSNQADRDSDGLGNACDNDSDNDGLIDAVDTDDDNDGVLDTVDMHPLDPTRWLADSNMLYTFNGDSAFDYFGDSVSSAGDVNGDSYADVIVGAYNDDNNGTDSGSARVLSGIDGAILYTFNGDNAGDWFGYSVSAAGDVNNDGYDDVIVGAYYDDNNGSNSGSARVFSGADGAVLYTFNGDSASDYFGYSVSGAGDVNGDSYADVIVGAYLDDNNGSNSGSARVLSGVDGSILYTFNGDSAQDNFGISVSAAGDVNNDGYADVIVGAYLDDNNGGNSGSARVLSGADGSILYTFNGDSADDYFGRSVSAAGDANNDGYADVIVGADSDDNNGTDSGSARILSGADGSILYTFNGDSAGDFFGRSVSAAGDVNNDGYADVIVGAYLDDNNGSNSGSARVLSGMDGSILYTFNGDNSYHYFGRSVSVVGDVNNDGYVDVIVGAPGADNNGTNTDSGSARVFSGKGLWLDTDSDGLNDAVDTDDDNDGVLDINDNWPLDGSRSADTDGDGIDNIVDNCFSVANPDQLNTDGDAQGNACDTDDDNDGVLDTVDSFPLDATRSAGNTNIVHTFNGDSASDYFGASVSAAGDVNNDGYADVIVGASQDDNNGTDSGSARVLSGVDGSILYTFNGESASDFFGYSVSGAGDVNNDGYADVIVGALYDDNNGTDSGSARILSGADGSILYTFNGDSANDYFGRSVSAAGDVNNDGYDDLVVGSSAYVRVFNGLNGATLYSFVINGLSVSAAGDINNDGYDDIIVGTPANVARIYSGLNGAILYTFNGDNTDDQFGASVSAAGDVNNDGYADVIVGAYRDDNNGTDSGSARVLSGIDGAILYTFNGDNAGDWFGYSVSAAGDVNNDGYDDVIVGAYYDDNNGSNSGSARVFSGADGAVLYTFNGDSANDYFGRSVSVVGDVNNDGYVDVIVGADSDDNNGLYSGSARIFSGKGLWSDFDSDGQNDAVDTDDDNDGVLDINDTHPLNPALSVDSDGDGVDDSIDNCVAIYNPDQLDTDSDGQGNVCDADDDNDTVLDVDDSFPLDASRSVGNTNILYAFSGVAVENQLGVAVDSVGDINQDGYADVIVGAWQEDANGVEAGAVRVYSGLDGGVLFLKKGSAASDLFGYAVSGGGDVNNDGIPDFVVGAYQNDASASNAGSATVYSGADGNVLYAFNGDSANDFFGWAVSIAGDVNGDGYADIVIGADQDDNSGTNAGSATVFSGVDGAVLYTLNGDGANDYFGVAVGAAGDVNNDGYADVLVGAFLDDNNGTDAGSARVFSGMDGSILYTFNGDSAGDKLGRNVSSAGDINNDGYADIILGASFDDDYGTDSGSARVYSGSDGSVLYTVYGELAGDRLGYAASGAGDVNNDGYADFVIGAYQDDNDGTDSGSARIYSGLDGNLLYVFNGNTISGEEWFGVSVSEAGDINNDGYADVIIGAERNDNNGLTNSGSAQIFSGKGLWTDFDNDGLNDAVDTDDDNDGVLDINDAWPLDASRTIDADGDGVDDSIDICLGVYDPAQLDTDSDGMGDGCDMDDDNDGVLDVSDAFPLDATESVDTDGDGIGNNADTDDDNDDLSDVREPTYGTNPLVQDTDGDGLWDGEEVDIFFTDPLLGDTDGDGIGDGHEIVYGLNPLNPNDDLLDADGDGWTNEQEITLGSDPNDAASKPSAIGGSNKVGYYNVGNTTKYTDGYAQMGTALGLNGETITDLSTYTLENNIGILIAGNGASLGFPTAWTSQESKIDSFVANGGVLIFHDWSPGTATKTAITGSDNVSVIYGGGSQIDLSPSIPSEIQAGPGGSLTDASLDGGSSSNHGYVTPATVPVGSVPILIRPGTNEWISYYYPYGQGYVIYGAMPLSYYLPGGGGVGNVSTPGMQIYIKNLINFAELHLARASDVDEDGMPDDWEDAYGLDKNNAADALGDLDGDGLINLQEYLNETDPTVQDTDSDGWDDYREVMVERSDPLVVDAIIPANPADNDFNNDGVGDILLRSTSGNDWRLFSMSAGVATSSSAYAAYANANWQFIASEDFDADNDTDVLLRDSTSGLWHLFTTQYGAVSGVSTLGLFADTNWQMEFVVDVNGDGTKDVVVHNTSTNDWRVFYISVGAVSGSAPLGPLGVTGWTVEAAADLDGDGDADFIRRRISDGYWQAFIVNAGVIDTPVGLNLYQNANWQLQFTSDLDNDGDHDIVMRNISNGDWRSFEIQGPAVVSNSKFSLYLNLNWSFDHLNDVDADGDEDIVLRSTSGGWRLFLTSGLDVASNTPIALYQSNDWESASLIDVDGNGTRDVIMHNTVNGDWRSFMLSTGVVTGNVSPGLYLNPDWTIQDN